GQRDPRVPAVPGGAHLRGSEEGIPQGVEPFVEPVRRCRKERRPGWPPFFFLVQGGRASLGRLVKAPLGHRAPRISRQRAMQRSGAPKASMCCCLILTPVAC